MTAENFLREDLTPYEETIAVLDLVAHHLATKAKWRTFKAHHPTERHAAGHALRLLARGDSGHSELKGATGVEASDLDALFAGLLGERDGMRVSSFVNNRLSLIDLPTDVQAACQAGSIHYTKAKLIGKVEDHSERQALLQRVIEEKLPHAKLSQLVADANGQSERDEDLFRRLIRTRRALKTRWDQLPSKERARAERLVTELEAIPDVSVSKSPPRRNN